MPTSIFDGKRVVLGVTGSIAAYKAAIIASQLTQQGAQVDVIMTDAAQRFVAPLTFQALTGRPVYTNLWQTENGGGLGTHIAHVGLAHQADLLLIAPCTAQTIARIALGLSDDLLSITALAAQCPILIAPAMDAGMYENAATQAHVGTLRSRGVQFAGPTMGRMASGFEGLGRFIEPDEIIGHVRRVLGMRGSLAGRRVVITAGPTQEALDPVRYLSNHSSGKQGYAIAQAAVEAGAEVLIVSGPVHLPVPVGAERISVLSAEEMRHAVIEHTCAEPRVDVLIAAAAVADFRPAEYSTQKIKKKENDGAPTVYLTRNPDILFDVSQQPIRPRVTVGFAAESQDLVSNAQYKLNRKGLDLIVANDITADDAGFAVDTNRVLFVTHDGIDELPLMGKDEVAARIIEWVAQHLKSE